ncbi:SLC13 family permease [Verrucomicrobia bacterium]|nr:SLC13 family permease [Verrucomicrobiota bacterium]
MEMTWVLLLVLLTFIGMVWERIPADMVAMSAFALLLVTRVLEPNEAFSVFGNDAVITVAGMFILSKALERTGFISLIGQRLHKVAGWTQFGLLISILPVVALLSAFMNNTPVVVVFMPILITLGLQRDLKPSKLLIPLSYASIFGGLCTLLGTSTNILVSSTAVSLNQEPIGMFELAKIGVPLGIVGMIYLLTIGRKLLPSRETLTSLIQSTVSKQYLTEVVVVRGSPLEGKRLEDTLLKTLPKSRARIIEVIRRRVPLSTPLNEIELQIGDRLCLSSVVGAVMEIQDVEGLEILPGQNLGLESLGGERAAVVECVVAPDSSMIGRTLKQANFRQRFGVLILAVHRKGVNIQEQLGKTRLDFGDTLLVQGSQTAINQLKENPNFLMLQDVPDDIKARKDRMGLAIGTIAALVILASLGVFPISALAIFGALIVILGGCLEPEEAYRAINWRLVFMIFGMLSLGIALEKTGTAGLLADTFINGFNWVPVDIRPYVMLSLLYLLTNVLTEFLSNNAVAVLLTPVVINTAIGLGVDPRPFIIVVALAASASFATPIGYQTNTLAYGAGGYKFRDFIKVGSPLNLIFWIMSSCLVPLLWPL